MAQMVYEPIGAAAEAMLRLLQYYVPAGEPRLTFAWDGRAADVVVSRPGFHLHQTLRWTASELEGYFAEAFLANYQQRTGLLRPVVRDVLQLYQATGVRRVGISAIEIGAYAWLKYGFLPTPRAWQELVRRHHPMGCPPTVPADARLAIDALLANPSPYAAWQLADHPHGKPLLTGKPWSGGFDFSNPLQLSRLRAYTAGA